MCIRGQQLGLWLIVFPVVVCLQSVFSCLHSPLVNILPEHNYLQLCPLRGPSIYLTHRPFCHLSSRSFLSKTLTIHHTMSETSQVVQWLRLHASNAGVKKRKESEVAQSCLTLCNPMDCSLQGSSVHGIFQARVLEWIAFSFSRRSS